MIKSSKRGSEYGKSLIRLSLVASALTVIGFTSGCETGGGFNIDGTGSSATGSGNYQGTTPGGTTIGGGGTVSVGVGQKPVVGGVIYVTIPFGGGSSGSANGAIQRIHPDGVTVDATTNFIY